MNGLKFDVNDELRIDFMDNLKVLETSLNECHECQQTIEKESIADPGTIARTIIGFVKLITVPSTIAFGSGTKALASFVTSTLAKMTKDSAPSRVSCEKDTFKFTISDGTEEIEKVVLNDSHYALFSALNYSFGRVTATKEAIIAEITYVEEIYGRTVELRNRSNLLKDDLYFQIFKDLKEFAMKFDGYVKRHSGGGRGILIGYH